MYTINSLNLKKVSGVLNNKKETEISETINSEVEISNIKINDVELVQVKKKTRTTPARKKQKTVIREKEIEVIKKETTNSGCNVNINETLGGENLTVTSLSVESGIIENSNIEKNQQDSDHENNFISNLVKNNLPFENSGPTADNLLSTFDQIELNVDKHDLKNFENRARKTLVNASVLATEVLVSMMTEDSATNSLKVDCAKEILNRVYGKTFTDGSSSSEKFSMSDDLLKYCE